MNQKSLSCFGKPCERRYPWWVWIALVLTAIVGTTTYGMTMGILGGVERILLAGLSCTLAAGLAWGIPLPALYILNSMSGSRLSDQFDSARGAGHDKLGRPGDDRVDPYQLVLHRRRAIRAIHPCSEPGCVCRRPAMAMIDVFGRVMQKLEPARGRLPAMWLILVAAIGG